MGTRDIVTGKCRDVPPSQLLEFKKIQVKLGHYTFKIK